MDVLRIGHVIAMTRYIPEIDWQNVSYGYTHPYARHSTNFLALRKQLTWWTSSRNTGAGMRLRCPEGTSPINAQGGLLRATKLPILFRKVP